MERTNINDLGRELTPEELEALHGGKGDAKKPGHVCDEFCKARGHHKDEPTESGDPSGSYGDPSGGLYGGY